MCAAPGNSVMAFASVAGTVCGDAADLLILGNPVGQVGQNRSITDVASRDLDGVDLQCLFVDAEMYFAPDPPFGAAMLAGVPLTFTLDLAPCAVDQHVQRPPGAAIRGCSRPVSSGGETAC